MPSFKAVTFRPRSSSLCSRSFLTDPGHFLWLHTVGPIFACPQFLKINHQRFCFSSTLASSERSEAVRAVFWTRWSGSWTRCPETSSSEIRPVDSGLSDRNLGFRRELSKKTWERFLYRYLFASPCRKLFRLSGSFSWRTSLLRCLHLKPA